jgi:FixJ family two-component response regulator
MTRGTKCRRLRFGAVALIDDDRRVLTSLANLLASGGYGTRAYECALDFSNGCSGLVCVITDLGMRSIDGIEVLDRTVYSDATTPVIIITGRFQTEVQHGV